MAEKYLNVKIINKHDTSTNWSQHNDLVPSSGEIIIYTDLHKIKVGDGVSTLSILPFIDDKDLSNYVTTSTLASTISATVSAINKTIDTLEGEVITNTESIQQLLSSVMDYEDLGTI